jgi:hypothetical protein
MIQRVAFLAAAIALVSGTSSVAASSGPATVTTSFYKWYFSVNATKGGWSGHFAEARPYLDPSLYALIGKVLAEERKSGGAVLDFDPFVDAQERASGFSVGSAPSEKSPANVPVSLTFGSSAQRGHITAVVRMNDTWQITNFSYGSDGDLRSIIAKALK